MRFLAGGMSKVRGGRVRLGVFPELGWIRHDTKVYLSVFVVLNLAELVNHDAMISTCSDTCLIKFDTHVPSSSCFVLHFRGLESTDGGIETKLSKSGPLQPSQLKYPPFKNHGSGK